MGFFGVLGFEEFWMEGRGSFFMNCVEWTLLYVVLVIVGDG